MDKRNNHQHDDNDDDDNETNPYLQMRKQKIARNQQRLLELGLLTTNTATTATTTTNNNRQSPHLSNTTNNNNTGKKRRSAASSNEENNEQPPPPPPLRRSARNNKNVDSIVGMVDVETTSTTNLAVDDHDTKGKIYNNQANNPPPRKKTATTTSSAAAATATTPPPNSAKSISLNTNKLLSKLLLQPLTTFGKEFVITTSFQEAAMEQDKLRLVLGSTSSSLSSSSLPPRTISFNKYCGVQEWNNVIFLWVNYLTTVNNGQYINEFTNDGRHMSWYGGSKMREDSPIIQKLIRVGKEQAVVGSSATTRAMPTNSGTDASSSSIISTDNTTSPASLDATSLSTTIDTTTTTKITTSPSSTSTISSSDQIVLWCRTHDPETNKLTPYTCFGRLSYVTHKVGSQPVAFIWNLLDYDSILRDEEKRNVFLSMVNY